MEIHDLKLSVTTDASGDGTATAPSEVVGFLYKIHFIDDGLSDSHTAVLSLTETAGGVDETIWSTTAGDTDSDVWVHPLKQAVDPSNDAISGQYGYILLAGKPKLTIASGGNAKTGGCVLYYFR